MNSDSYRKYSQTTEKRVAFLNRIKHYVTERPSWTPAEGALLVTGVVPPLKGCKEIPMAAVDLRQLDDPDLPATQSQLGNARYVFEDYLDYVEDGDLPPRDDVPPYEFLKWCYDSDPPPWRVTKLPEFLRYLFFPGSPEHPFMLSVADELASLTVMSVATEAAAALNAQPLSHADVPARINIVQHRINDSKQRTNELDVAIERAIRIAESDETGPVWRELRKMALDGAHPFTGKVRDDENSMDRRSADSLFYATDTVRKNGNRVARLTKDALSSRLNRRRKRLAN
ncbi:hypothetical protein JVX96_00425 [Variovorax sp. PDNC026]|uniref:hypothetical protein n=1 Tax=Variovorax sp. PDNC026 TaxID=2811425 RepID=UPI0019658161|nr:hypothetical protein [Variovorax sp. PDNC026]QRY31830.1 hypothetical protein JVX96_00425 [Variovorax sp. PDNC026]